MKILFNRMFDFSKVNNHLQFFVITFINRSSLILFSLLSIAIITFYIFDIGDLTYLFPFNLIFIINFLFIYLIARKRPEIKILSIAFTLNIYFFFTILLLYHSDDRPYYYLTLALPMLIYWVNYQKTSFLIVLSYIILEIILYAFFNIPAGLPPSAITNQVFSMLILNIIFYTVVNYINGIFIEIDKKNISLKENNLALFEHKKLFDLCPDPLCILDFDGKFILANPAFYGHIAYTVEELKQKSLLEIISETDKEKIASLLKKMTQTDISVIQFKVEFIDKDSSLRLFQFNCSSVRDNKRFYCSIKDVTEQIRYENDIKEYQHFLRDIQFIAGLAYFRYDKKRFICSQNLRYLFSMTADLEISLSHLWTHFSDSDSDKLNAMIVDCFENGKNSQDQFSCKINQSLKVFSVFIKSYQESDGKVKEIVGILQDITEIKEKETTINQLFGYKDMLHHATSFAIISTDVQGNIVSFSQAAEKMLGFQAEEVIHKETPLRFHKKEELYSLSAKLSEIYNQTVPADFTLFKFIMRQNYVYTNAWTYLRKDSSEIKVSIQFSIIYDKQKNEIGYMGIIKDVTEEIAIKKQLEDDEYRLRLVLENTGSMVYDLDYRSGEIKWLGDFYAILKTKNENIIDQLDITRWEEHIHPNERDNVIVELERAAQEKRRFEMEYLFKDIHGIYQYVADKGIFLYDVFGKPYRMLGVMNNVNDRKWREIKQQQTLQLNYSLVRLNEKFDKIHHYQEIYTVLFQELENIFPEIDYIILDFSELDKTLHYKSTLHKKLNKDAIVDLLSSDHRIVKNKIIKTYLDLSNDIDSNDYKQFLLLINQRNFINYYLLLLVENDLVNDLLSEQIILFQNYFLQQFNFIEERIYEKINREKLQIAMNQIVKTSANVFGKDYFDLIAKSFYKIVSADITYIGRFINDNEMQTVSICKKGKILNNIILNINHMPCQLVKEQNYVWIDHHLQDRFSLHPLIIESKIQTYVGISLHSSTNQHLGVIVALFQDKQADTDFMRNILTIFAQRVASEIERSEKETDLKLANKRYQNFIKQSTEGIYRYDCFPPISTKLTEREQAILLFERGVIRECNDEFARMYGYQSAEDILNLRLTELLEVNDEMISAFVEFVRNDYKFVNIETEEFDKKGHKHFFINNTIAIIENNFIYNVWGTQQDVSELRAKDFEIKQSEERYKSFVAHSTEAIWRLEANPPVSIDCEIETAIQRLMQSLVIAEGNQAYAEIFGYKSVNEIIGKKLTDFISNKSALKKLLTDLIHANFNFQNKISEEKDKFGNTVFVMNNSHAVINEKKELQRIWGIQRNVTNEKLAELKLKESEERYKIFIQQSSEAIYRIEFIRPISLKLSKDKLVEKIIENGVMAEYNDAFFTAANLPSNVSLKNKAIVDLFPREYLVDSIHKLITAQYQLNNLLVNLVPDVYTLNSLIGTIENGYLMRIWGVGRNISELIKKERELMISNQYLQGMALASPDLIIIYELNSDKINFINDRFINVLEWDSNKIQNLSQIIEACRFKSDKSRIQSRKKELFDLHYGEFINFEIQVRSTNDDDIWLEWREAILEYDESNKDIKTIIFLRNITQKKLAELSIIENEKKFRALFENAQEAVLIVDSKSLKILDVNPQVEKLLAENKERLIGNVFFKYSPRFQSNLANSNRILKEKLEDASRGIKQMFEWELISSDGFIAETEIRIDMIPNKNSHHYKISIIDISYRKQAEKALERSEFLFRTLFEKSPVGMVLSDDKGEIMNVNSAFQEFVEYDFKELLGKRVDFFTASEDLEKSKQFSRRLRNSEIDEFTFEKRYKTKNNQIKWAVVKAAMIPDEHNKPEVVIAQVIDINERKKAEMQREEFLKMLRSKNEELESIVYVTSHDLRSPLVNIQGFSKEIQLYHQDLLNKVNQIKDDALRQEIESIIKNDLIDSFQYIYKSSIKMDQLLNGLLKLSRLGRISYEIVEINMNELIQSISGIIKYQLNATDTEIKVKNLLPCFGDLLQINQLFSNLIDNAIKYRSTDRKCKIEIWSEKLDAHYANYYVKDNGIGIADMHQHKIFELFHRLNPESNIKGEGLGLTIIKRIVERHKGEISVKSKENQGSTFIIKLPIEPFESNF